MRTRQTVLLTAFLGVALSGCATHGIHQARTHVSEHGITAISYPENHRVAFLKRNNDVEYLCAGPGVDVASSSMGGLSLGVGGISGSDEKIGDSHESIETGLGGRDPAVLIAREILYRTCETVMNNELSPDQAGELYKIALEAVKSIAQSQANTGTEVQTEVLMTPARDE